MRVALTTERLMLRRLTDADVDHLVELDSDPAVLRYINGGIPTPRAVMRDEILPRFLQYDDRSDGYGFWAAVERSTDQFLGWFCLLPVEGKGATVASLGYRLRQSSWGKGYGTEGARALIQKAFTELGVQCIEATTYEHNMASRRVMEKVGMTLVRTYRLTPEQLESGGTSVASPDVWDGDEVDYAIQNADWEADVSEER